MDETFGRVEMRFGLDHVERGLQCLRTRRALCLLKEAACEPATETLGADWPGLAMPVDVEIGEAGPVRGVEQLGRLRQLNEDVRLRRAAPARVPVLLGYGLVERRHPALGFLQLRPQRLERGLVVLFQGRDSLQRIGREGCTGIDGSLLDELIQRIVNLPMATSPGLLWPPYAR